MKKKESTEQLLEEISKLNEKIKELSEEKENIEKTLDNIISDMPGHVYWKNKEGVYLGCNEKQARSLGLQSAKEIIGKTDIDLSKDPNMAKVFRENDLLVISSGRPSTVEENVIIGDSKRTMLGQKTPLKNNHGQIVGVIGISLDITDRKNLENNLLLAKEAAEAANQAKTEFVQNMQHDIRTPSSGLWGVLDILAKSEQNSDRKEALNMALTASKRLLDLCNDAVEFGDLSNNARPTVEREFDIRGLAKSVIELNLPAAFAKGLLIHFKVDASVPDHVVSDEFRFSRILINLLGNSIKFSHKGEITLSIRAKINKDNERHGVLIIELKDMGIGIAKDKIKNIFEKFTRGVASNTNKYPGTGLGLYVVKTFVDELDGDMYVDSHEGEGAYFKLSLPFKVLWEDIKKSGIEIDEYFESSFKEKTEKDEGTKSKDDRKASENTPFNHELLIIEDDKTCLFAEKNLLSGYTHKIDSAENVADALKKLAAKRYDLVISDLGLPDGSGNDIVAQIKASSESPNYRTPFVAMTAHQDAVKHKQAMDAGFDAVGTKPLSTEKAIEFLRTYPAKSDQIDHEEEGLAVIDIALGMQRIGSQTEGNAIEALGLLYETFQEDIPRLKEAQKNNDIEEARDVLHKIRGGLYYTGTPRLEEAFKLLHAEVKRTPELSKIKDMFNLVYHEINLFIAQFKELVGIDKK